jgi:hypothetical protein
MAPTPTPTRTYRGRPGCGCGCRGRYAEPGSRAFQNDVRDVAAAIAAGSRDVGPIDDDPVVAVETDTRYLWLYFATVADAEAFVAAHAPAPGTPEGDAFWAPAGY